MNIELRYLSYLRRGMSRLIGDSADEAGVPQTAEATISIRLDTGGTLIEREFGLQGPGTVVGIATGEVLRSFPAADTQDHPPNAFPCVELKTPDLPWRYTAAEANEERLIPWLVLVVIPEGPAASLSAGVPLPVLTVEDAAELPDLREAWAWAHVQVGDSEPDLELLLAERPETVWARLVCPRYLEPDTAYLACLVPSFEAGRRAGLGLATAGTAPGELAFGPDAGSVSLPVYHSWRFSTALEPADFEELVRRLVPITLGTEVGVAPLDLSAPGSTRLPDRDVTVGYEGALISPVLEPLPWPEPHRTRFQAGLAELLADAAPAAARPPGDYLPSRDDPVVAPSRYGLLPAGLDEIPPPAARPGPRAPRWLSEANLDPRQRAVAGVGAEVVRRNQERLMARAWEQAEGIGTLNRVLNQTRLAREVGLRREQRLSALGGPALLQLTAGAHPRLAGQQGRTVYGTLRDSDAPTGLVSGAFRRQLRSGGLFARALEPGGDASPSAGAAARLTRQGLTDPGALIAHADPTIPYGVVLTTEAVSTTPAAVPNVGVATVDFSAHARTATGLPDAARRARRRVVRRERRRSASALPKPVKALEPSAAVVVDAVTLAASVTAAEAPGRHTRTVDSVSGVHDFALAGSGLGSLDARGLDVESLAASVKAQLDPTELLGLRLRHIVEPPGILGREPVPATVHAEPIIDDPVYADVVRIDPELLLPGVGTLPSDSVGLAAVNAAHVEALLLGANHELAREFRWREYPADLTGTWLASFWDRRAATSGATADIAPIAGWTGRPLGTHPAPGVDPGQTLVLVLKAELLRRYPGTLVGAVPARWTEREGRTVREEDPDGIPLLPVFTGSLGRDVSFLGFEFPASVDVDRDLAGSPDPAAGRPGWYFCFEQPPTEPQFGLDTAASDTDPTLRYWKDLSWNDARLDSAARHVQLGALSGTLPYDDRGANTFEEAWADSAAGMARITLQRPVRMLVHADQMIGGAAS